MRCSDLGKFCQAMCLWWLQGNRVTGLQGYKMVTGSSCQVDKHAAACARDHGTKGRPEVGLEQSFKGFGKGLMQDSGLEGRPGGRRGGEGGEAK